MCTTLSGDCFAAILEQLKTAEEDPEKTEEAKNLLEQLISGIFEVVYSLQRELMLHLEIFVSKREYISLGT